MTEKSTFRRALALLGSRVQDKGHLGYFLDGHPATAVAIMREAARIAAAGGAA